MEHDNGSADLEVENGSVQASEAHGGGGVGAFVKKAVWHGGSVYDAWLNAVSAQVIAEAKHMHV